MPLNLQTKTQHIYSVLELTQDIKLILENTFGEVGVEGEVSGVLKIATGTLFFSLKDNASILKCVMFSSYARDIKFELKDGLNLICFGRIGVYEKEGKYQLYVQKLEPKGIGSLQLALEQLKQKLEKEGLFRSERKRPIPYLPAKIGIVTSLAGAAIKDILKILERRFKDIEIIIRSTQVQGASAKEDIVQAIRELNFLNNTLPRGEKIEVMIVGRGGGSLEDLWAFNEEIVAQAIYNSKIPVISAVGHERDVTIADLVADLRAPTPSAAAELVIPKREDLKERLENLRQALKKSFGDILIGRQEEMESLCHRLALLNPLLLINQHQQGITKLARQIYLSVNYFLKLRQSEFNLAVEKLSSLSPLNILSRGYSITFKIPEEAIIKEAKVIKVGDKIKTRLHKGEILSQVLSKKE